MHSRNTILRIAVTVCPSEGPASPRVREICRRFGLRTRAETIRLIDDLPVALQPSQILLIAGPSGSGKTAALRRLAEQLGPRAVHVDRQAPPDRCAVIDQVAPDASLADALSALTASGLAEPRLWLRRYAELSEGERFRVRLAVAVGEARRCGAVLLADEFCATLHRRLARAIAFHLRKTVSRYGLRMIVATPREDLLDDLRPDWLLRLGGARPCLASQRPRVGPVSFAAGLRIVPGQTGDYTRFADMHYRRREGLGPLDRIFVLRDGANEAVGVIVYGYPPLSLRLRNQATAGRYHRRGRDLNRDFRILRRLILHPDLRGCGLGHWLVEQTLPLVGTRYVECMAAMGAVNPVFERAGMVRMGVVCRPDEHARAEEALARLGVDPLEEDFARIVERRADVRQVVAASVRTWLRRTTCRPLERVDAMSGRQLAAGYLQLMGADPVYYLWSLDPCERDRLREIAGGRPPASP